MLLLSTRIFVVVSIWSTTFYETIDAATFVNSISVSHIVVNSSLKLDSNSDNGYHFEATKDLCEEAVTGLGLCVNVEGSGGRSCGYDVTPEGEAESTLELNLGQCIGKNDQFFYLKKIEETTNGENKEGDKYLAYEEARSLRPTAYVGSQEYLGSSSS